MVVYALIQLFAPNSLIFRGEIEESKKLISEIEEYYERHETLPNERDLNKIRNKLGWELNESCPCYKQTDQRNYKVWFGIRGVGSSLVYSSKTVGIHFGQRGGILLNSGFP